MPEDCSFCCQQAKEKRRSLNAIFQREANSAILTLLTVIWPALSSKLTFHCPWEGQRTHLFLRGRPYCFALFLTETLTAKVTNRSFHNPAKQTNTNRAAETGNENGHCFTNLEKLRKVATVVLKPRDHT